MEQTKQQSKSAAVIMKTMYAAMRLLQQHGGALELSEIKNLIREDTSMNFTEWELERPSEKTTLPRWEVNMGFYSSDYQRAGFIKKDNGVWYLTPDGEKMLAQSPENVFNAARTAYRIWAKENGESEDMGSEIAEIPVPTESMKIEDIESQAMDGIKEHIRHMNPYEFQDLVAALLRGMGYYTPFVAPKGKDGGIDVVAYENAAGIGGRLIVQVKHQPTTTLEVITVRSLAALLKKDADTGMVVTSGRFTGESLRFARESKNNIRLIDGDELVRLWIACYQSLTEKDKCLMPLRPIYFIR